MTAKARNAILRRINLVVGQVAGIARMIEEKRDFTEIYRQLAAIKAAVAGPDVLLVTEELKLDKKRCLI